MRTFIAIEISEEIRNALAQIQSHLRYSGADVKWVEKAKIHITMKFLGEVSEEKIEKIKNILDKIAKETKPFEITIRDIGAFPKIEYPRVIWAGIDKGADELKELAQKIDDALAEFGFEKEARPFAAHLTIGRVRSPKNKQVLKEKIESCRLSTFGCQLVKSVAIFQSALTAGGPLYTKLHEVKFTAV